MKSQIITFHCVVKNRLGQVLSSSFNQDVINQQGASQGRLPGLVDGLQSVASGEKRKIVVPANRAYGVYDPALVLELQRSELGYGARLALGSQILRRVEGRSEELLFRVIRLDDERVVLDGNHPLAGHDLIFEVEIVSAREAKLEDILDDSLPKAGQFVH